MSLLAREVPVVVQPGEELGQTGGSHLVSEVNLAAWQDLPRDQQTRFLTNFILALERTGGLLPGVVEADQEVSVSSDNLRKLQITFLVSLDLLISIFYIYLSPDHGHAPFASKTI